jgi:GntR family transcriptional regulator
MTSRVPIRQNSLSSQILDIMIEKIRGNEYPPDTPLPTENQVASEFKVSRATIRSAFDRLEAMGLIYRRQGVGTFVRRISNIQNPLNQFVNFYDLIRDNGYRPRYEQLRAEIVPAIAEIAQNLHLAPDQRLLVTEKMFYADDIPIIYCINYIPTWVFENEFTDEQATQPDLIEPGFINFFEEKCHQRINYFISEVQAEILKNCDIPRFLPQKELNSSVLVISEIGYNEHDQPILQSIEYHPGNRMKFRLIRTR